MRNDHFGPDSLVFIIISYGKRYRATKKRSKDIGSKKKEQVSTKLDGK